MLFFALAVRGREPAALSCGKGGSAIDLSPSLVTLSAIVGSSDISRVLSYLGRAVCGRDPRGEYGGNGPRSCTIATRCNFGHNSGSCKARWALLSQQMSQEKYHGVKSVQFGAKGGEIVGKVGRFYTEVAIPGR